MFRPLQIENCTCRLNDVSVLITSSMRCCNSQARSFNLHMHASDGTKIYSTSFLHTATHMLCYPVEILILP